MNSLILLAAGQGRRMGGSVNKVLMETNGHPLIWYTIRNIFDSQKLDELIIVTIKEERHLFEEIIDSFRPNISVKWADGGDTRKDSVKNGILQVSDSSRVLLVHDGARPFVEGKAFDKIFESIDEAHPAAIYALPSIDTMKSVQQNLVVNTMDRSGLYRAQTPQGILTKLYRQILLQKEFDHSIITDDSSIWEQESIPIRLIPGSEKYFKVTTPEDWVRVNAMTQNDSFSIRIGQGYDIHRFDKSKPLYLGGIKLSDKDGLLGHSDADVLIHAIMDALLGAAGLPDIGHIFPDTNPMYKGVCSLSLLEKVRDMIFEAGYQIGNIDTTVLAEKPRIANHIGKMKETIADVLNLNLEQVNIKATTNEKIGAIGREEGIAAMASVILYRRNV